VTSPDGDRARTASDRLVLAWLFGAPVAGTWLVAGGRARGWPVVAGVVLLLAWSALLLAAWSRTRRRRVVPAARGVAAPVDALAAGGHPGVTFDGSADRPTAGGGPRRAAMLAIRAAALDQGHEEGIDFVVEGVPSSLAAEPVQVRWQGDLLELGSSE
jgi:hypothetical protein